MSDTPPNISLSQIMRASDEIERANALRFRAEQRVEELEAEKKRLYIEREALAREVRVIEETKMQLTMWLEERGDEIEELKLKVMRLQKQLEGES